VSLDVRPGVSDAAVESGVADRSHLVLLYRIVLEAISNARKHSGGSFIGVSVATPAADAIEIRIADNGSAGALPFGENAGLALMRRRAEEIGAAIEYEPTAGGGTTVVVRLGSATADGDGAPPAGAPTEEATWNDQARPEI
jgi:signal transduction histidine kinase